ncbi:BlaI/MecI/CopY family transcriptional regulator [Actinacidiphila acididurans]|uniref:BlaI/MecI/CopY family transcriptional regulator n=1 Tax=Actinacidiphila acididurans TaxID=2784346 RepID=A0ABS2TPJ8_9ACTN|nr:BlaI/MecI/CopY family transcriptional regulator [Actinacidiphila acididurans]MBM9505263.1 BlaI/MecI/CopY family transcriptional regulator [Actinacidiphila acididurans]
MAGGTATGTHDGAAPRRARGALEGEVLAALWRARGPVAAAVVQADVAGDIAYTTVLTVLTRLCDKGIVRRERAGRGYAYTAVQGEVDLAAARMHSVLNDGGDRAAVLARFVSDLSADDERLLERLLRGEATD